MPRSEMTAERKRILLLIPQLGAGGSERVFITLLRHLDRSRFEIHLGLLSAKGPLMTGVPDDVILHNLNVSRVRYAVRAVVRLAWKVRPHTILATQAHMNATVAAAKFLMPPGTKLLIRQSGSATQRMELVNPKNWGLVYRWLYRMADAIVCPCDEAVRELSNHFGLPQKKLVRIYNPIDIEWIRRMAETGGDPYSGPGPRIVAVGRLRWEKGYDVLLDAMREVVNACPTAQLHILGDGPRHDDLIRQRQRLGLDNAVRLAGYESNPWRYIRHADLLVLPSRNDLLPNAVLEALVLGTPVVATDCPGSIREIQQCGGNMVLVPPDDPSALAAAIITQTRNQSFEAVNGEFSRFDSRNVIKQYSDLLL